MLRSLRSDSRRVAEKHEVKKLHAPSNQRVRKWEKKWVVLGDTSVRVFRWVRTDVFAEPIKGKILKPNPRDKFLKVKTGQYSTAKPVGSLISPTGGLGSVHLPEQSSGKSVDAVTDDENSASGPPDLLDDVAGSVAAEPLSIRAHLLPPSLRASNTASDDLNDVDRFGEHGPMSVTIDDNSALSAPTPGGSTPPSPPSDSEDDNRSRRHFYLQDDDSLDMYPRDSAAKRFRGD